MTEQRGGSVADAEADELFGQRAEVDVGAAGSAKSRPAAISGSRRANSSGSSMNSVVANSGLTTRAC
jgi:hypothetical protein